jgi:hypothetical protein
VAPTPVLTTASAWLPASKNTSAPGACIASPSKIRCASHNHFGLPSNTATPTTRATTTPASPTGTKPSRRTPSRTYLPWRPDYPDAGLNTASGMSNHLTASAIGAQGGSAITPAPTMSDWRWSFVTGFGFELLILVLAVSRRASGVTGDRRRQQLDRHGARDPPFAAAGIRATCLARHARAAHVSTGEDHEPAQRGLADVPSAVGERLPNWCGLDN